MTLKTPVLTGSTAPNALKSAKSSTTSRTYSYGRKPSTSSNPASHHAVRPDLSKQTSTHGVDVHRPPIASSTYCWRLLSPPERST